MRGLLIGLLVLVGLLVAADFGAAALAESAVSREMRGQLGLADDPSVRINGFPFLTQAVSGDYSSVDVDAQRIAAGPFRQLEVSAQLHDVRAPLPMLLGSGAKTVHVANATGTVQVGATDIQRLVPGLTKARIESVDATALTDLVKKGADPALAQLDPDRTARLVGTISVGGQPVELAALVTLDLSKGHATLVPHDLRLSDGTPLPLPAETQRSLMKQFALPLDTGALPLHVQPTGFTVKNGTLAVSGKAADLTFGPS
jgi:LmeA-like phospholipid-binding